MEEKGLTTQDDLKQLPVEKEAIKNQPLSEFQNQIEALIPTAGTIQLTNKQREILFAPVNEEDVCIRPDGLIYLPWMEFVSRLRDAFGISWALIPKGNPSSKGDLVLWGFWLVIDGHLQGFAVGEQLYQPTNATMTYGDVLEGCTSNALMRLCKRNGICLELWKPSFIKGWKEKYAESYPAVWPDGKPKNDKNGKQKTEWKKKGTETPIEEIPEVEIDKDVDMETFKKESEELMNKMKKTMESFTTLKDMQTFWSKYLENPKDRKFLLPEHFTMLSRIKDEIKGKLK